MAIIPNEHRRTRRKDIAIFIAHCIEYGLYITVMLITAWILSAV